MLAWHQPYLYARLVVERRSTRMKNAEGVGVHLYHKPDGKLFQRYLRNAHESCLTECHFVDDVVILATSRARAERALQGYIEVAQDFCLTVSIPKTKIMASVLENCSMKTSKSPRGLYHSSLNISVHSSRSLHQ